MKNTRNPFLTIALSVFIGMNTAHAQQESQFANVIQNPYVFNPAAGGMTNLLQVDLAYRNQWLASTGNPTTVYLSGHAQIKFGKSGNGLGEFNLKREPFYTNPTRTIGNIKHVVGGKVISDGIGPFQKTGVYGSYAVHLPMTKKLNVGLGLSAGWGNFQIDPSKTMALDQNDNTLSQFTSSRSKQNVLDAQAGLVIYGERFYFGISGTQLLNNTVSIENVETGNALNRHLFIVSSYLFEINDEFEVEPFVILKGVKNSPLSLDIGSKVHYHKFAWAGLQYRTGNSFAVSFGANFLNNFRASYAFEYGAKKVRMSNAGTHEIHLGYLIGNNRNVDKEIKKTKAKDKM